MTWWIRLLFLVYLVPWSWSSSASISTKKSNLIQIYHEGPWCTFHVLQRSPVKNLLDVRNLNSWINPILRANLNLNGSPDFDDPTTNRCYIKASFKFDPEQVLTLKWLKGWRFRSFFLMILIVLKRVILGYRLPHLRHPRPITGINAQLCVRQDPEIYSKTIEIKDFCSENFWQICPGCGNNFFWNSSFRARAAKSSGGCTTNNWSHCWKHSASG